jgi:hypothetical protein
MVTKNTFANPMAIYAFNMEKHLKIRQKIIRTLSDTFGLPQCHSLRSHYFKYNGMHKTQAAVEDTITLYCNEKFNFE